MGQHSVREPVASNDFGDSFVYQCTEDIGLSARNSMPKNKITYDSLDRALNSGGKTVSYAVLHALFKTTAVKNNPIRDIYDCFVPFVIGESKECSGQQLDLQEIQATISKKYNIDIPIYTIEHLIPQLQEMEIVKYDKISKLHYIVEAKREPIQEGVINQISEDIEKISRSIEKYAQTRGTSDVLYSASWADAVINFLKPSDTRAKSPKSFRQLIISDPLHIEEYFIADFIRKVHDEDEDVYNAVLHIFIGVLIEEFVHSITEFGLEDSYDKLTIYYDTSLLLRILGTSGRLFKAATLEFHRYLGDLNIKTEFFSVNEEEVGNILSAIVNQKDYGFDIYGETGEAIARGEVSVSDLRSLQYSFVDKLAALGIFTAQYEGSGFQKHVQGQIDEPKFSTGLIEESRKQLRQYSKENALRDAVSVAHTIRMRRGKVIRDISEASGIFVTNNRLLANYSRKFAISEGQLKPIELTPVMHVSQACTIFWLAKDKQITDRNASAELLANCYEALSPDDDFYKELFEKINELPSENTMDASVMLAIRRVAKEESFGKSVILQKLSMAEIVGRAKASVDEERKIKSREMEAEKKASIEKGAVEERQRLDERHRQKSQRIAYNLLMVPYSVLLLAIFIVLGVDMFGLLDGFGLFAYIVKFMAYCFIILTVIDYFRIWNITNVSRHIIDWLANKIYGILYGLN